MRALSLLGPRRVSLIDAPPPSPAAGEVLVRIRACGVCASDLNAWRGVPGIEYPLPAGAPGHEVLGEVVALGPDVDGLRLGECVTGLMWNGLAELGLSRAEHLVALPSGSGELLGEPLACAMNVIRRSQLQAGQRFGIVGFGYLAALMVQLLPEGAGDWVAISRREDSRTLALTLGAEAAYDFENVFPSMIVSLFLMIREDNRLQSIH